MRDSPRNFNRASGGGGWGGHRRSALLPRDVNKAGYCGNMRSAEEETTAMNIEQETRGHGSGRVNKHLDSKFACFYGRFKRYIRKQHCVILYPIPSAQSRSRLFWINGARPSFTYFRHRDDFGNGIAV